MTAMHLLYNKIFYQIFHASTTIYTRAAQWASGKGILKNASMTDIIVCRVCEGGDLELPIDGVGTSAARIGTWEAVRKVGGALSTVH